MVVNAGAINISRRPTIAMTMINSINVKAPARSTRNARAAS
jgi:hypothetical protein